jgi:phosphonate transport system ATP-binding protein
MPKNKRTAEEDLSMEPILRFRNVTKNYPNGVHALKNVSLDVQEGEFISVIGPSGSGKSTLLRAINRLIPITNGEVFLDGESVGYLRGKELRNVRHKVGMIFQNYNLVYSLSVLQNVLHGRLGYMSGVKGIFGLYSEEDKQAALDLLDEMGMKQYCYHRASDLSGGQKQRVGIARAINQNPRLLLCDEPIASLDPSSAKTIMDLLHDMTRKRNIACIVNLHQLDVALKYSTRIIGLSKGEIVFDGKPEELTRHKIELIYGASSENLMIGGAVNEAKQHSLDCA